MKKEFAYTKVTVRLRKKPDADEWYLYLESYPVYKPGSSKPCRTREYINRIITTPIFVTSSNPHSKGHPMTTKPKRDSNGVIMCKADADKIACRFANEVRNIRQKEQDNREIFTDIETKLDIQQQKMNEDFIQYVVNLNARLHVNSNKNTCARWLRTIQLIRQFAKGETIKFKDIDFEFVSNFKNFLLTTPNTRHPKEKLNINTSSLYFQCFTSSIQRAYKEQYLDKDYTQNTAQIKKQEAKRNYLTQDELNRLAQTPCDDPDLKRSALFSALTGLRHSDVCNLRFADLVTENGQTKIIFTQQKTHGVEYLPVSRQAVQLCGTSDNPDDFIFKPMRGMTAQRKYLSRWIKDAGITKKITFHCFRHTFATLQLANGTDIYTVSKMLGHTDVKTTQIYAKVIDAKKDKAAAAIHIDNL